MPDVSFQFSVLQVCVRVPDMFQVRRDQERAQRTERPMSRVMLKAGLRARQQ